MKCMIGDDEMQEWCVQECKIGDIEMQDWGITSPNHIKYY